MPWEIGNGERGDEEEEEEEEKMHSAGAHHHPELSSSSSSSSIIYDKLSDEIKELFMLYVLQHQVDVPLSPAAAGMPKKRDEDMQHQDQTMRIIEQQQEEVMHIHIQRDNCRSQKRQQQSLRVKFSIQCTELMEEPDIRELLHDQEMGYEDWADLTHHTLMQYPRYAHIHAWLHDLKQVL
jgi:hypothetical protein